jgi:hypothetical protein
MKKVSKYLLTFEVLTMMKISIVVFWVVTQCGLVDVYQCLTLKMEAIRSSETLLTTYKTTRCLHSQQT